MNSPATADVATLVTRTTLLPIFLNSLGRLGNRGLGILGSFGTGILGNLGFGIGGILGVGIDGIRILIGGILIGGIHRRLLLPNIIGFASFDSKKNKTLSFLLKR